MARPDIPDELAAEVESFHESRHNYQPKSFQEALRTVLDAAVGGPPRESNGWDALPDPVGHAVENDTTHPRELTDRVGRDGTEKTAIVGRVDSLLGVSLNNDSPTQGVYRSQDAIKRLVEQAANDEISTDTRNRLVDTYAQARSHHVESKRETRRRRSNGLSKTRTLKAPIKEFLEANYIEPELEKKTGFRDFETAADHLREPIVHHLDP